MQVVPIDFVAIVAIVMGISVILIPVAGLTARFALKPVVEAFGRVFESRGQQETVRILERRVTFLEQQLEHMEETVLHLQEVTDFHERLDAGSADPMDTPGREP